MNWRACTGSNEEADTLGDDESAAWSKLEGYVPRFALVIHLTRWASGDPDVPAPDTPVDATSMASAIRLVRWFARETLRVYAMLGKSEGDRELIELEKWIADRGGSTSVRELQRGPVKYRGAGAAAQALDRLVAHGRATEAWIPPGVEGGPPTKLGRESWYLAAALAGLRRGDMVKLAWRDVNFAEGTLTIRHGKAKREDVIPMHPQLAESLRTHHAARPGLPTARVWPEAVGNLTRTKDFLRAGIAKLVPVLDADGNPIKICEGDKAKTKTRISAEDADGRVIDLHALRTTLGTQLARSGVTPQVAQKIMRHSDYRTTLRHYTVLGLNDTSKAMDSLPGVRPKSNEAQAATGTTDAGSADCRPYCQQLERENDNRSAKTRDGARGADRYGREQKSLKIAAFCDDARRGAEVERTRHQSNSWSAM
ncbi:MAG: tyrosine-type recombinase/integrase [Phycisphaerales bacterium]